MNLCGAPDVVWLVGVRQVLGLGLLVKVSFLLRKKHAPFHSCCACFTGFAKPALWYYYIFHFKRNWKLFVFSHKGFHIWMNFTGGWMVSVFCLK